MAAHRMAAVDAQFYWMSAKISSDQFLLYVFNGVPTRLGPAVDAVLRRARACADLTMRVEDDCPLTYPRWEPSAEHVGVVRGRPADDTWEGCLAAVAALADEQLDARRSPWRLHLFAPVCAVPGSAGPATVAVLQVAHALADGSRASALAAWLFGRDAPVPRVVSPAGACLPVRAFEASRAHRQLVADTRAGLLPAPAGSRPALGTNTRPAGVRSLRTLVRHRAQLPGPTVTVGVLSAVATALAGHLGGQVDSLGAEVPMVKPGTRLGHNHFRNVSVGLHPQLAPERRAERISADLANGRRRGEHPAARAADRAFAATPAPLLRWGVAQFDPDVRAPRVGGNTVVSSVHRGPADLWFGDAPVLLTAGYPALSPMMGLTHGVHGIGDTVAISVHAAESAIGDVDAYLRRLDAAL